MNIGPLLRNMMGEVKPGTPKTLELKAGQVVRGTVLSVSEDGQEAVIQVQGVKLHAALETPLREGQTTLLQVQPQTGDGLMKLKPIQTAQTGALSPASLASTLEALGLEDTSANREMLQMMQANGIPLTKENASRLLTLTAAKLPTIPLGEWVHAASIALNRGLPLTAETLTGLHQAVFGPPLHTLLASLEEQLGSLIQQGLPEHPGAAGAKETNIQGGSGQPAAGSGGTGTSGGSAASGSSGSPGASDAGGTSAVPAGTNTGSAGAAGPVSAGTGTAGSAQAQAQAGLGQALVQTDTGSLGQLLVKLQQVLDELKGASQPGGAAPGGPASASGEAGNAAAGGEAPARGNAAANAGAAAGGEEPAGPSPQSRPAPMAEPWVGRVLKLLGAEHEQQVLRAATPEAGARSAAQPASAGAAPGAATGGPMPGGGPEAAPGTAPPRADAAGAPAAPSGAAANHAAAASAGAVAKAAPEAAHLATGMAAAQADAAVPGTEPAALQGTSARDTLKGLLLQIAAADQLPAPLQEAAKQILHQLTGQQLLLTTDRTAPFAQVTMFLPIIGPDGEQTASVQIESRRGRKGELDPSNCRLWFDLQMKALGQIMVDVQVADRKVLLKIFSEQEAVGAFLESRQPEIEEALESAGYMLLQMKAEPLLPAEQGEKNGPELGSSLSYAPNPYKGVDYRV